MRNKPTIRRVGVTLNEPSPDLDFYGFGFFYPYESYIFTSFNVPVF